MGEDKDTVRLVSHGWKKRCGVCERQTHAKWHELAKGELNPVALIEWIESMPELALGVVAVKARIVGYILGCTGIDYKRMRAALTEEQPSDAVKARQVGRE